MSNTNPIPALDMSRFQGSVPRSEFLSRIGELTGKVQELTTAYNKLSDDFAELAKLVSAETPVEEKPVEQAKPEKQEKPKTEAKPKPQTKQPVKSQTKK
jgi:cell envelope opacity-associated protein A